MCSDYAAGVAADFDIDYCSSCRHLWVRQARFGSTCIQVDCNFADDLEYRNCDSDLKQSIAEHLREELGLHMRTWLASAQSLLYNMLRWHALG
jgi:hypothetical protein